MKNNKIEITWDNKIMQQCKILYCQHSKSMLETCMCWGFECGEGWKKPLQKLSFKLEELNLKYYPKYNIRIQADQVKEKYGTLRFYYSIHIDQNKFIRLILLPFKFLIKLLNNALISTNYKFLHKIKQCVTNIEYRLQNTKVSEKQLFIADCLNDIVDDLIDVTENECNDVCEDCGDSIDDKTDYNKKCETVGWITYICKRCAEKSNKVYMIDGKTYRGKTTWNDNNKNKNLIETK